MLCFGHQTVFNLCVGLIALTAVSIVCLALLFMERQDMDVLQRNIDSLEEENASLRLQLEQTRDPVALPDEVRTSRK